MNNAAAQDDLELQRAAVRMRNAHPGLWDELLTALDEYATRKARQLVTSPPDVVFRAQGYAWLAQHLAAKFRAAPDDVKRDEDMRNAANRR